MRVVKDSIHGNIRLSELENKLLDTPEMQRLRKIRQLAMAYLIYPGANHTRFEHSLGTMHVTGEICGCLELEKELAERLRLAALLHDVGHYAFSHDSELVIGGTVGDHEKIGRKLILKGEIADIIGEQYEPVKVADLLSNLELGQIIVSDVGSDRMDYLLRDSHYTGVAYGIIDADRIIHKISRWRGKIVVGEGGLEATEYLLMARYLMFSTVYFHRTVRIAAAMLRKALSLAREEIDWEQAYWYGDWEMLNKLKSTPKAQALAERIEKRDLFKQAYATKVSELENEVLKAGRKGELERLIGEEAGSEVIVDLPEYFVSEHTILILHDGELTPIGELSPMVKSLENAEESRLKMIVSCPKEKVKDVEKAAEKVVRKLGRG